MTAEKLTLLKQKAQQLQQRIDALKPRERILGFAVLVAASIAVWQMLWWQPQDQYRSKLIEQTQQIRQQTDTLNQQLILLAQVARQDPNAPLREREQRLREAMTAVERQLSEQTVNLVSPQQMTLLLESLLRQSARLQVIRLHSQTPRPLVLPGVSETHISGIFQHGVEIELEGSFADVVSFLQSLERRSKYFFWERLDYQVTDYPRARVTLTIRTLSLQEGWIGV